jgi:hypothetical protein
LFDTQWVASPSTGIVAIIMTQMDPTGDKEPKRTSVDFRNMLFSAIISTDSAKQPSAR